MGEAESCEDLFRSLVESFRLLAEDELFHSLDVERYLLVSSLLDALVDVGGEPADLEVAEILLVIIQFVQEEDQTE